MAVHLFRENHELTPDVLEMLNKEGRAWGVDTETTGLDVINDKVILLQIGDKDEQYLFDTRTFDPEPLREFLEGRRAFKVLHNAKFDYKMIRSNFGIELEKVRCTWIAEKILTQGRKKSGFSLDALLEQYLNIAMDKSTRKTFIEHTGPFSPAQIEYAAKDVEHLVPLYRAQTERIKKDGLINTLLLECEAVLAFGDMEHNGLLINQDGWKAIIKEHEEMLSEATKELDSYASQFLPLNLYGEPDVNYDSPKQVLDFLRVMDVRIPDTDAEGNTITIPIPNSNDDMLKRVKDIPATKALKNYRAANKVISTYGLPFLEVINPTTGRIHAEFDQLGTETGRPSCRRNERSVNMLNIPSRGALSKKLRNCFIAAEDHLIETDDYSGCELRILAHISGDVGLIEPLKQGKDLHCHVASKLYRVPVEKDNEHSHLRTPAKNLNFGICYGMGVMKLYNDLNSAGFEITLNDTTTLYNNYCREFKTAVDFLRNSGRTASTQGWLSNLNGRRRYWLLPNENDLTTFPMGRRDGKYRGVISKIERSGGNFCIQSVNADITKQAMVDIRRVIKEKGYRSKMVLQVYDEIVTETHKDDSPEFSLVKRKIMENAAYKWINRVPIEVEGTILPYWTK